MGFGNIRNSAFKAIHNANRGVTLITRVAVKAFIIKSFIRVNREPLLAAKTLGWLSISLAALTYASTTLLTTTSAINRYPLSISSSFIPKDSSNTEATISRNTSLPSDLEYDPEPRNSISANNSNTLIEQLQYKPEQTVSFLSGAEVFFLGVGTAVLIGLLRFILDLAQVKMRRDS